MDDEDKAYKDSKSLPVEESSGKPLPHPLQESGDQRDLVVNFVQWLAMKLQQEQQRQIREKAVEDPSKWEKLAQFMTKAIISLAKFFTFFVAAVTGIFKIEAEIPKENLRERDEIKEKEEEIKNTTLKEIEHHKWKLEEKIRKADEKSFRMSYIEKKKWEMSLIAAKYLVDSCRFDINYLQEAAEKLETEARATITAKKMITGVLVFALCGMLYYGAYVKENSETGMKGITVANLLAVGIAMFCKREVQVLFNNYKLVKECEQVKRELKKSEVVYKKCKEAVEVALPEQEKRLHVVDNEVSLYRSLQGLKCKED